MRFYDDRPLETDEYDYDFNGGGFRSDESSLWAITVAVISIIGGVSVTLYIIASAFFN